MWCALTMHSDISTVHSDIPIVCRHVVYSDISTVCRHVVYSDIPTVCRHVVYSDIPTVCRHVVYSDITTVHYATTPQAQQRLEPAGNTVEAVRGRRRSIAQGDGDPLATTW
jgi:hypothetical protein